MLFLDPKARVIEPLFPFALAFISYYDVVLRAIIGACGCFLINHSQPNTCTHSFKFISKLYKKQKAPFRSSMCERAHTKHKPKIKLSSPKMFARNTPKITQNQIMISRRISKLERDRQRSLPSSWLMRVNLGVSYDTKTPKRFLKCEI